MKSGRSSDEIIFETALWQSRIQQGGPTILHVVAFVCICGIRFVLSTISF